MKFLEKILSLFQSKKTNMLKKLRKEDKINVYPPDGYNVTINGKTYENQVITITIYNNDPKSKKIWFYFKVDGSQVSFVKSYRSEIFRDFILLNYQPEIIKESQKKSKKDLTKEIEEAISKENYELANLLNEELKKLKNGTN